MKKMIPYQKLSKKQQREINNAKRVTWGNLNPITRTAPSSRAYNRRKSQEWKRDLPPTTCDSFVYIPQTA